jgi:hypothetical protein
LPTIDGISGEYTFSTEVSITDTPFQQVSAKYFEPTAAGETP